MADLPVSTVVRVTVQGVQRSIAPLNVNNVALFTHEVPDNADPYRIYLTANDVVQDYGTDSLTARMAQNVFAQTPNPLTGGGYLAIVPMEGALSATAPITTTVNLTNNIENFKTVADGSLTIATNGQTYSISNMNFTRIKTLADIVAVLQNAFPDVFISIINENEIQFLGKKYGSNATLTISSGTDGTDIAVDSLLDIAQATETPGENSSGETLQDAMARMDGVLDFTGAFDTLYLEDTKIELVSSYVNARDILWCNVWTSATDILGICTDIKNASQEQTRCLLYTEGAEASKLMLAAYVGRSFSTNFRGVNTSQTMNLKTLTNVTPDTGINTTIENQAETAGVDLYVSIGGTPNVISTGGNGYFDTVYENLSLKYYAEVGVFNALRTTGTKIPQTEQGMMVLKDSLRDVAEQFIRVGVIAPGTWNNPDTFGDPEIFKENITNYGYYIYSVPIALQLQSEREQRIAPLIQMAVKRAGAIHKADVIIIVEE